MRKILFIVLLVFIPGIAYGSVASDFTINRQSTYAIPPGSTNILILDLTLPESDPGQTLRLQSIKINNAGTAQQYHFSKLYIFEDGPSPGWDGDENKRFTKLDSPFFDVVMASDTFIEYSGSQRIFVTVDIASDATTERTIQSQLTVNSLVFTNGETGPADAAITGFERMILAGTGLPTVPVTPFAKTPEALSTSTIRWHFTDMSNNEFGFKILDNNSKTVARNEQANLSYLDEIGLIPDTEYSGRQVIAFNDRGESLGSSLAVFSAVRTLTEEVIEEVEEATEEVEEEEAVEEEVEEELSLLETIQQKIAEIQQKINELLRQLNELLQEQTATVWTAFQQFFQSLFGK